MLAVIVQVFIFGLAGLCLRNAAPLTQGYRMTVEYLELKHWLQAEVVLYIGTIFGCVVFMAARSCKKMTYGLYPKDTTEKTDFLEAQQAYAGAVATCIALMTLYIFIFVMSTDDATIKIV